MKKFEKEVNFDENGVVEYICGMIEGREGGDWTEYKVGDKVIYKFDFDDEDYLLDLEEEFNIELNDIKELVGEGICLVVDEDIWYNISFKDNVLVVEYIVVECF